MKIQDIKVKVIDIEKLKAFLNVELEENQKLSIDKFAIFLYQFWIDTDCCFWEIHSGHFNNKIQPVIDIECRFKTYKPDGSYSIRIDKADFVKTISLEDSLSMATEENLIDFIRFNYNPRISGNQNLLMKYIRKYYAETPTA